MGVKNSKWVFLHPILLCHIFNGNKMNQYSPLIQKGSRGCCCLATRPNFRRSSAFWFACGKTLLRAIQSGYRRFRRACVGDAARSMISMCCASELKRLSSVIRGISRAFSRVRFYIFEGRKWSGRKAVRQTPCRIHSGRQSRPHFLAFWPHLLVFSRISVGKRQCVKHAYICEIGVSAIRKIPQNRRIFRLFAGVSRVSGVNTKKSITLQPRG